jgi:hypothetical protein
LPYQLKILVVLQTLTEEEVNSFFDQYKEAVAGIPPENMFIKMRPIFLIIQLNS